ncbi:MAG: Cof-type HAD-IIB family hydrolase [Synergistaceae bacterium]|jgi:Cof subfamily protein (haloacid dehalogenase superfamily)|nr:Cof-type HAD-IIB family hydrolase [Synergistaceae bacterium]
MPHVKLIATDLDGTLLDSTGKIPERNLRTLREAMAKGIATTICTGRMFVSARRFAEQIGIKIPLICYNGAMLRRPDGELIWHLTLGVELARKVLDVCLKRKVHIQSYVDDELYVRDADAEVFQEYKRHFGVTGKVIGDDIFNPPVNPTKLLAMTEDEETALSIMKEMKDVFGDDLYVTRSNANFVEMMNPSVNKANGLRKLAEEIGVDMADVLAIGDGENDVEMIKSAGVGVAMGNGAERIRAAADYTAPTNDEDGVAWAVERCALES